MGRWLRDLAGLTILVAVFGGMVFAYAVWHPWWLWRATQLWGAFLAARFLVRHGRRWWGRVKARSAAEA